MSEFLIFLGVKDGWNPILDNNNSFIRNTIQEKKNTQSYIRNIYEVVIGIW